MADKVIGALRRIIRAVDLRSRQIFAQCGMTVPQLIVLKRLAVNDALPVTTLTQQVHLSQATVTGILDRLEDRGLVRRVRSSRDRRCTEVHLTPVGKQALATAPQLLQESFQERLGSLHEWEQTLMLSSLQRVVAMLEARGVDAAPILSVGPIDALPADLASPSLNSQHPPSSGVPGPEVPGAPLGEPAAETG